MNLLKHIKRLTPDERSAAVLAAKAGDLGARDRLFADSYGLIVAYITRKGMRHRMQPDRIADFEQAAALSLIGSLRRTDLSRHPDPGVCFTLAAKWGFRMAYREFAIEWVKHCKRCMALSEILPYVVEQESESEPAIDHEQVRDAVRRLPERQAEIIRLRFGHDRQSLSQVASRFGVSRERIRQLEVQSLAAIRKILLAREGLAEEIERASWLKLKMARARDRMRRATKVATRQRIHDEIACLQSEYRQAKRTEAKTA